MRETRERIKIAQVIEAVENRQALEEQVPHKPIEVSHDEANRSENKEKPLSSINLLLIGFSQDYQRGNHPNRGQLNQVLGLDLIEVFHPQVHYQVHQPVQ